MATVKVKITREVPQAGFGREPKRQYKVIEQDVNARLPRRGIKVEDGAPLVPDWTDVPAEGEDQ